MAVFQTKTNVVNAEQWEPGKAVEGVVEIVHAPDGRPHGHLYNYTADRVNPNDWIVIDEVGVRSVLSPDEFSKKYEQLGICGVQKVYGTEHTPVACAHLRGHAGDHSWAYLDLVDRRPVKDSPPPVADPGLHPDFVTTPPYINDHIQAIASWMRGRFGSIVIVPSGGASMRCDNIVETVGDLLRQMAKE